MVVLSQFFEYKRIQEPLLRFYARRTYANPRTGITNAGPYSADNYRNNDINIGVLSEESIASYAENFIRYLKNGYNYFRGFKPTFKVNDLIISEPIKKLKLNQLSNNILSTIENYYFELAEKLPNYSVVIIILSDKIIEEHYRKIKAFRFKYTKKVIRLQLIKESTLNNALSSTSSLDFYLLNIATAIYAKVGGTPWLLDQMLLPAGVLIGIAFTKPRFLNEKEIFYYGILTIYNKYGRYVSMDAHGITKDYKDLKMLRTKGLYIPKKDMADMLSRIVNNYMPPIAIIYKSSKFHREEKEAIEEILKNKDIKYALIHIESSNPYRGYDPNSYNLTVARGDLILDKEISNRAIFFTTGSSQDSQRTKPGTPKPLELEVEENNTSFNIIDFSKQILSLTKLDWNTTDLEIRIPITIKYAYKVAGLSPFLFPNIITDIRDLM